MLCPAEPLRGLLGPQLVRKQQCCKVSAGRPQACTSRQVLAETHCPHVQHAHLVKSRDDPNTFLMNDTTDPLQRTLTSLELSDVLQGAPPPGACSTWAPPISGN